MLDNKMEMKIHAYADNELSPQEQKQVEDFLETSHEGRQELERVRLLNKQIAGTYAEATLSEIFEERAKTLLAREGSASQRARPAQSFSWAWSTAAAIFMLALCLPFILKSPEEADKVLLSFNDAHAMLLHKGPQYPTKDYDKAIQVVNTTIKTTFKTSTLRQQGLFKGYCSCSLAGTGSAIRLAFDIDGHPISLYVVAKGDGYPTPSLQKLKTTHWEYEVGKCGTFNVVKVRQGQGTLFLVGSLSTDRLLSIMENMIF